jgi:outer membrane murein-binding lipoprotein Lpp
MTSTPRFLTAALLLGVLAVAGCNKADKPASDQA